MNDSSSGTIKQTNKSKSFIKKLPNGFKINHYFQRYITTQYLLGGGLLINFMLSISYCQLKMKDSQYRYWFLEAGFYFNFFCILLLIVNAKTYYDYRIQYQAKNMTQDLTKLFIKFFMMVLRPYPFLQDQQIELNLQPSLNDDPQIHFVNMILATMGMTQAFILFSIFFNTSKLKNDRSTRICKMYGCKATDLYVTRGWFKRNYLLKLFSMFLAWALLCTSGFRIVQYRYNPSVESIENAFWLTFSTMFCIGFGDVCPKTNVGKWIALVAMYTGVIFTYFSLQLVITSNQIHVREYFILDEKRTVNLFISLQKKSELRLVSAEYIRVSLWRVWRNHKNKYVDTYKKKSINEIHLKRKMKILRLQTRNNKAGITVYNELKRHFENTTGYIDNLKQNNEKLVCQFLQDSLNKNQIKTYFEKRLTLDNPNFQQSS